MIDPRQWYPLGYDACWVKHKDCGGKMWQRMTPRWITFETACAKCFVNFNNDQLELFCKEEI